MNATFSRPAARPPRLAWDVPALAVGVSVGGGRAETVAVGCEPDARSSGSPRSRSRSPPTLALELLDLEADDRESGPTTSASVTCSRTRAATTASCRARPGAVRRRATTPSRRAVAELARCGGSWASSEVWSYANTGYWLAGHLCAQSRPGRTLRGRRRPRRSSRPAGPRGDLVRRAGARRHRPRGPGTGRIRGPGARRAASSRTSADLLRFGTLAPRPAGRGPAARPGGQADRRRLRARPLRRAGRRRRGLGARRLVRRLPVVAAARARPRRGLRRADEQQPRRQGRSTTLEDVVLRRGPRRAAACADRGRPAERRPATRTPASYANERRPLRGPRGARRARPRRRRTTSSRRGRSATRRSR